MKIRLVFKPSEIADCIGLYEFLNIICKSFKKKCCDIDILLYNEYIEDFTLITLGSAFAEGSYANIPLSGGLGVIADGLFEAVKNIYFGGGAQQYTVKLFGNVEATGGILNGIEKQNPDTMIFYYNQGLTGTIKILCRGGNAVSDVYEAFKNNIYADEEITIEKRLLELLSLRNKTLSVAESLTGGMICSDIVANDGASASFNEGIVSYSNDSKIKRLGIDGGVIKNYGAVSYETAYEMAAGLLAGGLCDISIATTGIAGPSGGTLTKPVGLTYIAVGTAEKVHVFRHIFSGTRNEIRKAASQAALFYAIRVLKDKSLDYEIKIN